VAADDSETRKTLLRRAGLASIVLLFGGVLALGLTFARGPVPVRTVTELREDLVACSGGDMAEGRLIEQEVQDCYYRVMSLAVHAGQLMDVQTALAAQIEETPGIYAACHSVGHRVGKEAFAKYKDIAELIRINDTTTCQYAFGHGILDGFAFSDPSDEEFQAAASACVAMRLLGPEGNKVYKLCSDGLGHAAWTSTDDIWGAVARCRMLDDPLARATCGEGIMMQIYEPAGSEPSRDIERAALEVPQFCLSWPDLGETREGCYSGSGYVYTRAAWVLHYQRNSSPGGVLTIEQRSRMQTLMLAAATLCGKHPDPKGVSVCLRSVAQQVPPSVYDDASLTDTVCTALGEFDSWCREFRFDVS
jgi:hypothetical protein